MAKKKLKPLAKAAIIVGSILGTVIVAAGGYVLFVICSYSRIGDQVLTVDKKATKDKLEVGTSYSAASYNIGFGAYSQDYTFFLDTGYDENGNATCGHWSTARSKDEVLFNVKGAISTIKELNPDFIAFQEVDTKATRSYKINQDEMIVDAFSDMDHTHAVNYHTVFLPYPLYDMHGSVNAGLTTLSKFSVKEAERKQYTVSTSFSKFFDLDRCFSYQKMEVANGKNFYFVNSHMSAYDEGGLIKAEQMKELNSFLQERKNNNDYVIVAGDYNHDLLTYNPEYSYTKTSKPFGETKKDPDWVVNWFGEDGASPIIDGYSMIASDNTPTCRNNDIEWIPGKTYTCVVDGFIVSDNIEITAHKNIKTKNGKKGIDGFAYGDHDPATIEFKLKA